MKIESKVIEVSIIEENKGQIDGVPKNPRTISEERYKALKKSIKEFPEMLMIREPVVVPYMNRYVALGGNMRIRACKDEGIKKIKCKVITTATSEQMREYVIKDNEGYGETEWSVIAKDWGFEELKNWDIHIPENWQETTDVNIDDFFTDSQVTKKKKKTVICPHCQKEFEL